MLSQLDKTQARLTEYRAEKALMVDPMDDDGAFPSFKEWSLQLDSERQPGDYRTVTVEQADEEMDAVLDEVDNQPSTATATKESDSMNTTTDGTTPASEQTANTETTAAAPAKAKRVRKPAAKKAAAKTSKADKARAIFKRMSRGKNLNREKIIGLFQTEAGLSKAGAATYYQSLKGKGKKAA